MREHNPARLITDMPDDELRAAADPPTRSAPVPRYGLGASGGQVALLIAASGAACA
jgi:hypothetical protein